MGIVKIPKIDLRNAPNNNEVAAVNFTPKGNFKTQSTGSGAQGPTNSLKRFAAEVFRFSKAQFKVFVEGSHLSCLEVESWHLKLIPRDSPSRQMC